MEQSPATQARIRALRRPGDQYSVTSGLSFEFRGVVTSSRDERGSLPKSKCMDEHELAGVHSEAATVLRFPRDGYIRGPTGPAREYTFNGQLLRVVQGWRGPTKVLLRLR